MKGRWRRKYKMKRLEGGHLIVRIWWNACLCKESVHFVWSGTHLPLELVKPTWELRYATLCCILLLFLLVFLFLLLVLLLFIDVFVLLIELWRWFFCAYIKISSLSSSPYLFLVPSFFGRFAEPCRSFRVSKHTCHLPCVTSAAHKEITFHSRWKFVKCLGCCCWCFISFGKIGQSKQQVVWQCLSPCHGKEAAGCLLQGRQLAVFDEQEIWKAPSSHLSWK